MSNEKYFLQSEKLRAIMEDCAHFNNGASVFLNIALKNIEERVVDTGIDMDDFEIRERDFTGVGCQIDSFVREYMDCSVDRVYEFVHPKLPEDGILVFMSASQGLANVAPHLAYSLRVGGDIYHMGFGGGAVQAISHS